MTKSIGEFLTVLIVATATMLIDHLLFHNDTSGMVWSAIASIWVRLTGVNLFS